MTTNKKQRLSIGLDSSTQSLSAIIIDIDTAEKCFEHSIDYRAEERTNGFGVGEDYILPPKSVGEAEQPPLMYLASLDAMFSDIRSAGIAIENIVAVNTSGQQHGHVYLNQNTDIIFSNLSRAESTTLELQTLLAGVFSYNTAPIWMTSNTVSQTNHVREAVGGKTKTIDLSGSDVPLRFTGGVIRRVAEQNPDNYAATKLIQLISSFIPAVLTGNSSVPIDTGNACGMSLMNYRDRVWDNELLAATADGIPGEVEGLQAKLPELTPPDSVVGNISLYFSEKYGFDRECKIIAGSGDNPQAKVPVAGDLLSLGTSFVNMVSTDGNTLDPEGYANAMYDGIGRPFMFGCRTNGAMVWDAVRANYGYEKEQYTPAEEALSSVSPGEFMTFWQPKTESFPVSGAFDLIRADNSKTPNLAQDYTGVIETSLAAVYVYSQVFTQKTDNPLYITGGATDSPQIMRRVAGIWNRPVVAVEKGGAALGAAVAGAHAYCKSVDENFDIETFSSSVQKRGEIIPPNSIDTEAYHGNGNYLHKFREIYEKIIQDNPV
ncbi:xylulose kinase [Candidatus Poribacteria bacterium]|nr:xylulose kinase [Candidatus Poribacteria bacterium]